jgi:hypothetical protein
MFLRFYPESEEVHIESFVKSVMRSSPRPTPAELQHHFIMHRRDETAAAAVFEGTSEPHLEKGAATMWS